MDSSNEARHSAAHYFLEGLNEIGFDYLFCNFGTDHAPLIEAMAAFKRADRPAPATILCPHENTAVHMAAGYAIATGRGQGVMVHVDAGTANSAMALHNLCRARIPVLLMAGKAPFTTRGELLGTRDTYVHFVQEPFDQASVVRPYTKWEYNLPSGVIAKEALRRAHTVMQSDPARARLSHLPARDPDRAVVGGPDPLLSGGALRRRWRRAPPTPRSIDAIVTQAAGGRAAVADLVLCRPQPCHRRAARRAGALRRHPGRRVQSSLRQPAARFALPRRLHAGQGAGRGRCRPAGRCRRAVDPERHAGQSRDLVGAYRRRCREAQFPDVDLPRQPAPAGRQPSHSHRPSGRAEGQGRCRLQGARRRAGEADGGGGQGAARAGGQGGRHAAARRPDQPALPVRGARQGAEAVRHRAERGDPQRARGGPADAAHQAGHAGRPGRRRPGLLGRHGAGPEARHAGAHDRADRRRRHLLLLQSAIDPGRVAPLQAAGPDRRARQFRLGRGEGGDAARLSRRRGQGRQRVRRHPGARHGFLQGRRGRRCARRTRVATLPPSRAPSHAASTPCAPAARPCCMRK